MDKIERTIAAVEEKVASAAAGDDARVAAKAHYDLARLYYHRRQGNRSDNLNQAIDHNKQALVLWDQDADAVNWAKAQDFLGVLYGLRLSGDPLENLRLACDHQRAAVRTLTPLQVRYPVDWGRAQHNLGVTLFRLQQLSEEPETYQEQAIACFNTVLPVRREISLEAWAETRIYLAQVYLDRVQHQRTKNMAGGIDRLSPVMEMPAHPASLPQDPHPGEPDAHVEQIMTDLQDVIAKFTGASSSRALGMAQNALGIAFLNRLRGGRAENVEQAMAAFQKAQQALTDVPEEKARALHNLAAAYNERVYGDRHKNLTQAVAFGQQALGLVDRGAVVDWAMFNTDLVGMLWRLAGVEDDPEKVSEHLETAITCGEMVLAASDTHHIGYRRAFAAYNLANVYCDRREGNKAANRRAAIKYYQQALEFFTKESHPDRWANAHADLGVTFWELSHGQDKEEIQQAIYHYHKALEVFRPEIYPVETRRVARNLGDLYFHLEQWDASLAPYAAALTAAEDLYQASLLRSSKEAELNVIAELYQHLAYAQARDGDLKAAVVSLERGRARLLSDALARDRTGLVALQQDDEDLYNRYVAIAGEIAVLTREELHPSRASSFVSSIYDQVCVACNKLSVVVAEIRRVPGFEDFLTLPEFEHVAAIVRPDLPMVYVLVASVGSVALIVRRDAALTVDAVWLPRFTKRNLHSLLHRWFDAYARQDTASGFRVWLRTLDETTRALWGPLVGPLVADLVAHNESQSLIAPVGRLAFLPLHAAWHTGPNGTRCAALDHVVFITAPSARAVSYAQQMAAIPHTASLLAVSNPTGRLKYATQEIGSVARYFQETEVLKGEQATTSAVLNTLCKHTVFHFAGHGSNNPKNPLDSALEMAYYQRLTARDFMTTKKPFKLILAFLSACETGMMGGTLPDEVVGLPAAFLEAGTAGVISTLWRVDDESAAALVDHFYDFWRSQGFTPPRALAAAQCALRDTSRRFSHPYYWAAFAMTGAWIEPQGGA